MEQGAAATPTTDFTTAAAAAPSTTATSVAATPAPAALSAPHVSPRKRGV